MIKDYEAIKYQAKILYIKHGLTAVQIRKKIGVSERSLSKWINAGRWQDLRPDMEILAEYKAANLYVEKGMSTCEISQVLSVSEISVNVWVVKNGWDAAKLVTLAKDVRIDVVGDFCSYFKYIFPNDAALIEVAQNGYIKKI